MMSEYEKSRYGLKLGKQWDREKRKKVTLKNRTFRSATNVHWK